MNRFLNNLRLALASLILGRGWYGVISRLWIVYDRAKLCITKDGQVILSECKPLADALYADIPGQWKLTIEELPPTVRCQNCSGTGWSGEKDK